MSKKKPLLKRLIGTKYRFAIMNDETHQSLFFFRANRLKIVIALFFGIIAIVGLITILIAYTPLRQRIPGYPNNETVRDYYANVVKIDSLEREVNIMSLYLSNIQKVLLGQEPQKIDSLLSKAREGLDSARTTTRITSREDSLLREEMLKFEQSNLSRGFVNNASNIEGILFFSPVKGIVTQEYSPGTGHPYIDIAVAENTPVAAIYEGTVISSSRSDETGFNITIQHSNDIISVYKHLVKVLKNVGDKVSAGTIIGWAGETGTLTTGSHLHFELWYNGEVVNPVNYIKF